MQLPILKSPRSTGMMLLEIAITFSLVGLFVSAALGGKDVAAAIYTVALVLDNRLFQST